MPTTNPVPSNDPTDLLFNAGKLDEVVNGTANSFTDRLGVVRRTVAGMNADFDEQLADAESDLNVYRADAAASAAEALGYLQTIRATSYGAYASDPATDPLGNPPTVGDEYFNTTANMLKRWNGTTWQASDINTANLAASSGSSLVGYDGGTVQDVLDGAKSLQDYAALRAYNGRATRIYITGLLVTAKPAGIAGTFQHDPTDTTSSDNNGTIIVLADGRRFKRDFSGAVNAQWFEAKGDWNGVTGTDNSLAFQAAIDCLELAGGGELLVHGSFLVGGLEIDSRHITVCGGSENDEIVVKNGTTGIRVKQHWVNFCNLTIKSQGNKNDGLGTNGINYQQATQTSIGYVLNENLTITGFSGTGLKVNNAINFVLQRCYVVGCTTGVHLARDGTSAGNFSTTVDFENVYVSSCTTGIKGDRVYRSRFNVTGEYCTYAMDMNIGAFTLFRCYFENNTTLGARIVDCEAQDLFTYSNDPTDAVSITFTGATAAAERGYTQLNKFDTRTKRLGVLSQYGADLKYLDAHGTTSNLGLKYGENTVALVRGVNLLNESAWAANRIAELVGWDLVNQGYKVAGTSAGDTTYGIKQDVTLSNTKTYVIDLKTTTVAGSGITLIKVGSDTVTNGVPFTPSANGVNTVKCYGTDPVGTIFECYVNVFTLAEVVADVSQIAEANSRLTRIKGDRGVSYGAAAPTTGRWMLGEVIYNTAPTAGGFVGWVCTASGAPGTWKTFGAISA